MIICDHDTIAAPATAAGGAIAVIRLSGNDALTVCDRIFRGRQPLSTAAGYTVHYGCIVEPIRVTGKEPHMAGGQRTGDNGTGTAGPDRLEEPPIGITCCAEAICTEAGSQEKAAGKEAAAGKSDGETSADDRPHIGQMPADGRLHARNEPPVGNRPRPGNEPAAEVRLHAGNEPSAGETADAKTDACGRQTVAPERIVDDVLATVFRAPHSYTGEDSVEISCHGSQYIVAELLRLLTAAGARMAEPGEFTIRAYLNGKMDLSQAEAVADLIASSSRAAHALAANQMRGGYSEAFDGLRERLLNLASQLELELDFSEEEVEFADRTQLRETMERIAERIDSLRDSFTLGNVLKQGVAVAIAGAPNVGKSTLLNRLLNEERALVSDIAGTTRDVIEETANIDGVLFRFLDTAGIRSTDDRLERMGIERSLSSISRARIVIYLLDAAQLAGSAEPEPESGTDPASGPGWEPGLGSTPQPGSSPISGSASDSCSGSRTEKSLSIPSVLSTADFLKTVSGKHAENKCGSESSDHFACNPAEDPSGRQARNPTGIETGMAITAPVQAISGQPAQARNGADTFGCRLKDYPTPDFHMRSDQQLLVVANKLDTLSTRSPWGGQTDGTLPTNGSRFLLPKGVIGISAKNGEGIDALRTALRAAVDTEALYHGDTVISNSRHYEALTAAREALREAIKGLQCGLPTDLLSEEIRQVIRHIGLITGRGLIAPDEILQNIFSKFCIGK